MQGVTDHVYRELFTRRAPRLGFTVTEFLRVTDHPLSREVLLRSCPELARGGITRAGVPVSVQLLGSDPWALGASALAAVRAGARAIDLNFGCPARLVNLHDGGASLLRTPERLERAIAAVRAAVPAEIPVSAKIRLGWDSREGVADLARAVERGGAGLLTVHGRTRAELYGPPADHVAVGRAREAVAIPVIANGDLGPPGSFERCRAASGCDRFMVGRGAMACPSAVLGTRAADDARTVRELIEEYQELLVAAGATESRAIGRTKQWLGLAVRVEPTLVPLFDAMKRATSLVGARALLRAA